MNPTTLIIVVNWNAPAMTAECIRSLQAMRGATASVLVVDNGSRDGSVDYLRRHCDGTEVIANDANLGFAGGCNAGLRRALCDGYDYALLINNDTLVDGDLLSALVAEAERHPQAAILSPKILCFAAPDRIWWVGGTYSCWTGLARHTALGAPDRGEWDQLRSLPWATGCAMLLRCSALRQIGLFEEAIFANSEDVDLSLRAVQAGYQIMFVPRARLWHKEAVSYRRNAGDAARMFMQMRNTLWVWNKHARWWHHLAAWPYLLLGYIPKMCLLALLRGQSNPLWAMLKGIAAYHRMRRDPRDVSALPAVFRCPPMSREQAAEEVSR